MISQLPGGSAAFTWHLMLLCLIAIAISANATAADNHKVWVSGEKAEDPLQLAEEHWCKRPSNVSVQQDIENHLKAACQSSDKSSGQLLGYVSCIAPEHGNALSHSPLGIRRRTIDHGGDYVDEAVYAGMPVCAGDTMMTWRDLNITVQWTTSAQEKLANEAYKLNSYTQVRLDPAGSQLYGGRMDIHTDEQWKAREIHLGEHGPEMRTTGSKITLEIINRCEGEALVQVHKEPGSEGQHFAEIVRFNRRGKAMAPERISEGEVAEISNAKTRRLRGTQRLERVGDMEKSQSVVATLAPYEVENAENDVPPVTEASQLGTIELKVRPRSAQAFVEQREFALRLGRGAAAYSPGSYTITASAPGYLTKQSELLVTAGESTRWVIDLEKEPLAQVEKAADPPNTSDEASSSDSASGIDPDEGTATADELDGQSDTTNAGTCPTGYTYIGPGWFMMGSEDGYSNEMPVHRVDIDYGFCMKTTEVSNSEYAECVEDGGCTPTSEGCYGTATRQKDFTQPTHPVVCVTWTQASDYALWAGARLPSEAEWEYAARVGGPQEGESEADYTARATSPRIYAWGNTLPGQGDPLRGNFSKVGPEDGYVYTAPVGSFPNGRTPEGLLDMTGNVWEWTQDEWHDSYDGAPNNGIPWLQSADFTDGWRVILGGGWNSYPFDLRAAISYRYRAGDRGSNVGFRVVLPSPGHAP